MSRNYCFEISLLTNWKCVSILSMPQRPKSSSLSGRHTRTVVSQSVEDLNLSEPCKLYYFFSQNFFLLHSFCFLSLVLIMQAVCVSFNATGSRRYFFLLQQMIYQEGYLTSIA